MYKVFIIYTTHMKKTTWILSLAILLFSTFAPNFTYADVNQDSIEILNQILNDMSLFDNDWEEIIDDTEVTPEDCFWFENWVITSYLQDEDLESENVKCWTEIVIPNKINWEDVIEIWPEAFKWKKYNNVKLPDKLKVIWTWAFYFSPRIDWYWLKTINLPNSLEKINKDAFLNQTLESLIIPEKVKYIWEYAFDYNEYLTRLTLPENMSYIWKYAFYYTKIKDLKVDSDYIWEQAFWRNREMENLEIWNHTRIIDNNAFYFSRKLNSVVISDSVTHLWDYAFYCDYSDDHSSIKNLKLSENMTYLWNRAFTNCWLTSVVIPESVQVIWEYSFWNNLLESFKILWHNVTLLNWSSVVWANKNLWVIDLAWWIETITNDFANSLNPYWNVPLTIKIWSWTKYIEDRAFGWSYSIVSKIELPDTLISIWQYWFWYNIAEDMIYIPSSVTNIWQYAFHNRNHDEVSCTVAWWLENKTIASNMCTHIYTWYTVTFNTNGWTPNTIKSVIQRLWDSIKIQNYWIAKKWYVLNWWSTNIEWTGQLYNSWDLLGYSDEFWWLKINIFAQRKSIEEKAQETTDAIAYTEDTTVEIEGEDEQPLTWSNTTIELKTKEVESEEVKNEEDKTKVKEAEIKVSSDKTVEYEWWIEVYLEKTVNEQKEIIEWTAKFSAPIAVKIPVISDSEYVKVQVKHYWEEFGYKWLTLNPENDCDNWEAVNDKYNWENIEVKESNWEKYAIIYTCSASTFVAYTENQKPVEPSPAAGGWRTITPTKQETKITEQEHNSADLEKIEVEEVKSTETTDSPTIEEKVKKIEWKSLTRWEVAVMTNILLEVYPQLKNTHQELNEVIYACTHYADEQNFTKEEKKAITRLCKLSIMGIHNNTDKPLDEFMVNQTATNNEFSKVINRTIANFNEKDLTVVKEALKKLEWDEENVVFGTVYDVFMSIKNIFN